MTDATKRKRRSYSAEERAQTVALAREKGVIRAARELGVPQANVSHWLSVASQAALPGVPEPEPEAAVTVPTTAAVGAAPVPTMAAVGAAAVPATASVGASTPEPAQPLETSRTSKRARVAKVYTPTQIAQALERLGAIGVRPAVAELGMSRTTLRGWERKAARAAKGEGPAPTSGPAPQDVAARRDKAILDEWKKQVGLGPSQIRNQLRRAGMVVSTQTVRRVMEDAGYVPPKVERRAHTGTYEALRPNQLWHLDFVHRHIHKQNVFILALLDDYSRFVTGWTLDDAERADGVIAAFENAVARYGKPEALMHDGGSAFWSWKGSSRFTRILEEYGVDQVKVDVPQHNGKSEVFNGNLQKELLDRVTFGDVGELRRRLGSHFHWYNHQRTHHALGGLLVPADRFYGRVEEVLARIESGGMQDTLDLQGRALDLFRVTSTRGRAEVWLMGCKIFEVAEK